MGDRENKKILLVDIKKYRITEKLKDACISMGFEKSNIFVTSEAEAEDFSDFFEYYYVTAGNTFEILKEICNLYRQQRRCNACQNRCSPGIGF